MFDLGDIVISFVLGFLACGILVLWALQRIKNRLLEILNNEDTEEATQEDKIIPLKVEFANNRYFCYNNKTNQFVCWGDNVTEIIDHFKQRHPGLNAFFEAGDETVLSTLKQQLKEHRESSNSVGSTS